MNTALILEKEIEVREKLAEFGLTKKMLMDVVRKGAFAYDSATKDDPVTAAGFDTWRTIVRSLREDLRKNNWKSVSESNLDKTVNEEFGISIVCTSGNAAVGHADRTLLSKNDKGGTIERTLEQNRRQFDMFEDDFRTSPTDSNPTWMLVHHIDKNAREIRAELSLPFSLTDKRRIGEWQTRIMLGTVSLDNLKTTVLHTEENFTEEVAIPVIRKESKNE